MYVGLTVLLGQRTIPVRGPNVFATVLVTRIGLSKTVTPPTVAVVVDPAISVVTVTIVDVLVTDVAEDEIDVSVSVVAAEAVVGAGGGIAKVAVADVDACS